MTKSDEKYRDETKRWIDVFQIKKIYIWTYLFFAKIKDGLPNGALDKICQLISSLDETKFRKEIMTLAKICPSIITIENLQKLITLLPHQWPRV